MLVNLLYYKEAEVAEDVIYIPYTFEKSGEKHDTISMRVRLNELCICCYSILCGHIEIIAVLFVSGIQAKAVMADSHCAFLRRVKRTGHGNPLVPFWLLGECNEKGSG